MNAENLLAHFERISEAPDAIKRLRRFILDLAVRGKLVEQDPSDEPAAELLKRIAAEKARLVKAGEIKKEKPLAPIKDADFDLPKSWTWTRLGKVTSYIQRGKSPKYAVSDGSLVVSQKCVQWSGLDLTVAKRITLDSLVDYEKIRFLRDGDLLWNSTGTGTIGRIVRVVNPPEKLVCDSHVTVVRCLAIVPEYIRAWLRSDQVYALVEDRAAGSTNQVELTAQMAINQIVPLPPLAEQHRIVAKVDELMNLCDQLEATKSEREKCRDSLVAASLQGLNEPSEDEETFREHARFIFTNLPRITTRATHIKQLRQTILNLAVRGKLVQQDPNDESAENLLGWIASDKALLAKGKIRHKAEVISTLHADKVPHAAPPGWVWAAFGDIMYSRDRERIPVSKDERSRRAKVYDYYGASGVIDKIDNYLFSKPLLLIGEDGANLLSRSTPIAFMARGKYWVNNHAHVLDGISEEFLRFVELSINATNLKPYVTGTAQPKMNQAKMNTIPIALPPLAEQQRIVAKVDELMAICDQLEAQITATEQDGRRFLESVLVEAFAPNGDLKDEDIVTWLN
ncbi:MAG: restriction endonuclease subunit S [Cyanobacteria bacterium]|nr:restriction endonuclease subunit S [Cyanobacteriota bacterium]